MAPSSKDSKRLQGQARQMLAELSGLMLAHAFIKTRSAGFTLRVAHLDGTPWPPPLGHDPLRMNVDVTDGTVRKAWVG